jgi:hypothetical protein
VPVPLKVMPPLVSAVGVTVPMVAPAPPPLKVNDNVPV